MNLLALDLGTKTGFAIHQEGEPIIASTVCLASPQVVTLNKRDRMDRRLDPRVPALFNILVAHIKQYRIEWIVFEDVRFGKTLGQVQLWSSLRSAVWIAASLHNVVVECCDVGTLKKFASGFGASDKDGMAYALAKSDSRFKLEGKKLKDTLTNRFLDDNAVDAVHLLKWGLRLTQNLQNGHPSKT